MAAGGRFREIVSKKSSVRIAVIAVSVVLLVLVFAKLMQTEAEGKRDDLIELNSSSLLYAVELALDDTHITKEEAAKVTALDLSETSIELENFEDFENFENIETISINDSTIKSLEGIEKLKNLKSLRISNSKLDDHDALKNTDLVRLTVIRCGLSGTVDLGEMPLLASLDLSDNYIEALRGDFPQLTYLKLANNEIKTIDAVDIPQSTEELVLSGNPLESLDGLEQFDNIYKLKLYHTDIKDMSALHEMKGLTALYIDKEDMNSDLEFLYDDFRNGDNDRKREYVSRIYEIER